MKTLEHIKIFQIKKKTFEKENQTIIFQRDLIVYKDYSLESEGVQAYYDQMVSGVDKNHLNLSNPTPKKKVKLENGEHTQEVRKKNSD